ncbi:Ribosomal large subunit pseudouridine synthase D [Lachnospiraceae bacterium TWA4]|nr:Ribosomal large subunit pseudouridine synthase D [Lachnospiraceae bacterium TWA4]
MNRIIKYKISEDFNGMRIDTFLHLKGYSSQNLTQIKRMPKSILVNGIHYYMRQTLTTGDILEVCILEQEVSKKIPPVKLPLDIVYEDEDLIVLNKPAGMPIHPSMKNYENTLANGLAYYYEQQEKAFVFRCNNRLDRDTSGLTIVAKHLVSANILSTMSSKREIHREYLAIVQGHVNPKEGTIDAPIARKPDSIMERIVDFNHGEQAITHYKVLKTNEKYSLVSLVLKTGRTHQIRVHMKYLGYPLIGDFLYNPNCEDIKRQALHSHKLEFNHPITGEKMEFVAPLPDDMDLV